MYSYINVVLCGDDYGSLEAALTVPKHANVHQNVRRVVLYEGKLPERYELPVIVSNALKEEHVLFTDSEKLAEHLMGSTEDVVFFLSPYDTCHELYTNYIESFFQCMGDKCGVVYVPVLDNADDPLPNEFRNLPPGGLFVFDKSSDDFPSFVNGAAVLMDDVRGVVLDPVLGSGMFINVITCVSKSKGMYGRINRIALYKNVLPVLPVLQKNIKISGAVKGDFLVSCIIPIYNVEAYLHEAIDSVIAQNIGFEENVQLILVNDGSWDNSGNICHEYLMKHPNNVVYIEQKNQGVSTARNAGLDIVKGQYISFLDGDDIYEHNFYEVAINFLNEHYNEIDLLSVPLKLFGNIKEGQVHPLNYKFFANRVVCIDTDWKDIQLNICSVFCKSEAFANVRFLTNLDYSEDAQVIHNIILKKMKYGICIDTFLNYRKRFEDDSAVQISRKSIKWYLSCIEYVKQISKCVNKNNKLNKYSQFLIITQILSFDVKNLPIEVNDTIVNIFFDTIHEVINYIDDIVILEAKNMKEYIKLYLLSIKYKENITINYDKNELYYQLSDIRLGNINQNVWISHIEEFNGIITITGVYMAAQINDIDLMIISDDVKYPVATFNNIHKNNFFFGREVRKSLCFNCVINWREKNDGNIKFYLRHISGIIAPVVLCFSYTCGIEQRHQSFQLGTSKIISLNNINTLQVTNLTHISLNKFIENYIYAYYENEIYENSRNVITHFVKLFPIMSKRRIWIFIDHHDRADDNAEKLFQYLVNVEDGIEKYFVVTEDSPDYVRLQKYGKILKYGSVEQQVYTLFAEKYISSHSVQEVYFPFPKKSTKMFVGLLKRKYIFLQHGIITEDISEALNKLKFNYKMFVVSTKQEYNSILQHDYSYDDSVVKLTGLPRYDFLTSNPQKKIIIMFSWRASLSKGVNLYNPDFKHSQHYKILCNLMSDERIINICKTKGYEIILRLHPRFMCQNEDFKHLKYVTIAGNETSYNKLYEIGSLLITDYSSAVNDFAYLKKPIIHYQFDEYHFPPSYWNYESMGFGEVVNNHEDVIKLLIKYIKNGCIMSKKYKKRVDDFFTYTDKNNCERVYEAIKSL
ncbi:MAG: bifunctional glycosyltransferase family 2 protein/CDP-glycerol:glycerophosphate glycerophosphotransferase [Defluviitaleaceae bacterium]|nr:bifunctional glycosyltransferase family 2 protein/CDP-glycerol:glycerophosphate glycerophosphotransferase [Defluviitaleaceae bacterium]